MSGKRAFVTGATGFLGLNLVEQLTSVGWQVLALHRLTSDLTYLCRFPVEVVEGDLLQPQSLKRALPKNVDAVFHVAADTSVSAQGAAQQKRVNVEGTANLLQAALEARAKRFIHTSTWTTFGLQQGEITEDLPQLGGRSRVNYDRTKFQAEEEVRAAVGRGLDAVILNPSHIMGRYDRHSWARLIISLQKDWVPLAPPGAGCFCHGEAVAKAHIAAAERGRTGHNYLLGGDFASLLEVFRIIGEVAGCRAPKAVLPAAGFRIAARVNVMLAALLGYEPDLTPDGAAIASARARVVSDKAERELDYRAVPVRQLVEESYGWLKSQCLLRR